MPHNAGKHVLSKLFLLQKCCRTLLFVVPPTVYHLKFVNFDRSSFSNRVATVPQSNYTTSTGAGEGRTIKGRIRNHSQALGRRRRPNIKTWSPHARACRQVHRMSVADLQRRRLHKWRQCFIKQLPIPCSLRNFVIVEYLDQCAVNITNSSPIVLEGVVWGKMIVT